MIRRVLSMFMGGLMAAGASQAPEFAQQYRQRLGGAVDELALVVRDFDTDARRNGLSREEGLKRYEVSPERFLQDRGASTRRALERLPRLEAQKTAMDAPDVLTRVTAMVRDYDGEIARRAMGDYRPAVPLTVEGVFFALIGFAVGILLTAIVVLPMGRRRPRNTVSRQTAP